MSSAALARVQQYSLKKTADLLQEALAKALSLVKSSETRGLATINTNQCDVEQPLSFDIGIRCFKAWDSHRRWGFSPC
jgi:uncharacterized protein (DUF4213/DUF364 family)